MKENSEETRTFYNGMQEKIKGCNSNSGLVHIKQGI
jgi:hypothetical protein